MSNDSAIITPNQLKRMKFMQFILVSGPLLLFITAVGLFLSGYGIGSMVEQKSVLLISLTALHFALLALLFPVSVLLPIRFLNRFKKIRGDESSGKLVVAAHTIKIILLMIPAVFGISIIIISILKGILYEEALYWVNASSFFILLAQTLFQAPDFKRVEIWYGSSFDVT